MPDPGHTTHDDLWNYIEGLREDLGRAEERIGELETRLHDHEQLSPAVSDV